jgi:hypothetical protein
MAVLEGETKGRITTGCTQSPKQRALGDPGVGFDKKQIVQIELVRSIQKKGAKDDID